jgi:hypothetical protein
MREKLGWWWCWGIKERRERDLGTQSTTSNAFRCNRAHRTWRFGLEATKILQLFLEFDNTATEESHWILWSAFQNTPCIRAFRDEREKQWNAMEGWGDTWGRDLCTNTSPSCSFNKHACVHWQVRATNNNLGNWATDEKHVSVHSDLWENTAKQRTYNQLL